MIRIFKILKDQFPTRLLRVSIKNDKKNKGTITFVYLDVEQLNKIIYIIKYYY